MGPSLQLLHRSVLCDAKRDLPLHAQVRGALRRLIEEHFEDGEKFWTESALIEHLGVSQGTVRRALLDLTQEGLLQRQVAKGTFVQKTRTHETPVVGIFVPAYDSALYTSMLDCFSASCARDSRQMNVYHTHQGEKIAAANRQVVNPPDVERIVLLANPPEPTRELYESFHERGYRTVNIGLPFRGYPGAYVGVDDKRGIRVGLDHLRDLGHRRIALLVNEPANNPAIVERVEAFSALCREFGLAECEVADCGTEFWESSYAAGYGKMEDLFGANRGGRPSPTAVFAVSDQGAWGAQKWLMERGFKIPDRVSVLGYDDVQPSQFMHPSLSSVAQPVGAIAERALEVLWSREDGPSRHLITPTLSARESTGPVHN